MNLPARVDEIIRTLYEQNLKLANGSEDDRRTLTRMIAEQNCYELGLAWGTKATSSQAPQSKDAVAYRLAPGLMDVWDWQNGTTRQPQTHPGKPPDYPNLSGQYFIEVSPVNHLGGVVTPEPPVTPVEPPPPPKQYYPSKIGLRSVSSGKIVSCWDAPHTLIANRDETGIGEQFDVIVLAWSEVPPQ